MGKQVILAIDTSCDDTSVAIVSGQRVLANIVTGQYQIHQAYGGVFPTLAKQAHQENIEACLLAAMRQAGFIKNKQLQSQKLTAVAVTLGPGLAPALEVGIKFAKKIAQDWQLPLIPVNHIEAHALSPLLQAKNDQSAAKINFPILAMVVSGGHSEFIYFEKIGHYQRLGWTIDDSAGECLDKVGRLLDLGYPAGPLIEKMAKKGDAQRFKFPLPMTASQDFKLSFSGLKTAARQLIAQLKKKQQLDAQTSYDVAASIQKAVFRHLNYKLERILLSPEPEKNSYPASKLVKRIKKGEQPTTVSQINELWLGGGVAANIALRQSLRHTLKKYQHLSGKEIKLRLPYRKNFCGDNAAMIGLVANFHAQEKNYPAIAKLERQPRLHIDSIIRDQR